MVSLLEVTQAFVNGGPAQQTRNGSLIYTKTENGRKLISYNTCIGEVHDGIFYLNETQYSRSTSRVQNILRGLLSREFIDYTDLYDIPINTRRLHNG